MSYLRRDRLARAIKPKTGDHPIAGEDVQHPLNTSEEVDYTTLHAIESIYDDEVMMHMMEETEDNLQKLEDIVDQRLDNFQVLLDPDNNMPLVRAVSTLCYGELSLVLDANCVKKVRLYVLICVQYSLYC